jgi:class 3 adenylate cyclase
MPPLRGSNGSAAAAHGVRCILSEAVAEALADHARIHEIGEEAVRGISTPVRVCEYRPSLDPQLKRF